MVLKSGRRLNRATLLSSDGVVGECCSGACVPVIYGAALLVREFADAKGTGMDPVCVRTLLSLDGVIILAFDDGG